MRSDPAARPVAVIGGGFSGTMTAVQLSRRGIPSTLVERADRTGRGVAYSTREAVHLLNVPSGKMSAWPDDPDHFARWLDDAGTSFAERREFGRYVREQLAGADLVRVVRSQATGARRTGGGWQIRLASGDDVDTAALVLANGNQPPAPMPVGQSLAADRFVNNPWSEEAHAAVRRLAESDGDALILGTGLTMVDTVLSLAASGHRGRITALSRRGLIPRGHAAHEAAPIDETEVPHADLLALWRWLRKRSGTVGFRAAVDSLRPHSQELWQSWRPEQQRRFLRHARPWWDVHRHRIAPQVAAQLRDLIAAGQLRIMAGRVRALSEHGDEVVASVLPRGAEMPVEQRFACVFNCTGPLGDLRRTQDPLLQQLLADRIVGIDRHGIGLQVDNDNRAGERVWALGPLTKGRYWEIVAVPDIRGQAAAVADTIAQELAA